MAAVFRYIRMIRRTFLGLLFATLTFGTPLFAAGSRSPELSVTLTNAIAKLDREASMDSESAMMLADLIEKEFGTRREELKWGLAQKLSWGEITALAYIQATTGKSFAEMNQAMNQAEDARRNFWSYAENAGMSCEKMTHSLEGFLKRAEHERN